MFLQKETALPNLAVVPSAKGSAWKNRDTALHETDVCHHVKPLEGFMGFPEQAATVRQVVLQLR